MKQKGEVQVIATKVPTETKVKLCLIAEQLGMKFFGLSQALLLALLRTCDDTRSTITKDHDRMMQAFLNTSNKHHIDGALLFLNRSGMRPQLLAVTKGANGDFRESWNHDTMLLDFLRSADPTAAKVLQREAARHGHFSALAYLHDLIMQSQPSMEARMSEDIDEMFSDVRFATGDALNEDACFKNRHKPGDYLSIFTKVTREMKDKLNRIAGQWNMSLYQLQQSLLLALVRACDGSERLSPKYEMMLQSFINTLRSTDGSFNPLSIGGRDKEHLEDALLFVNRSPGMRPQLLAVTKGTDGDLRESWNHDTMLLDFLRAADPTAAKVLQCEAARHDHFSVLAYLHDLIMQSQPSMEARMSEDIRELFSDVRIGTGEKINEDVYYKRPYRYNKADYTAITDVRRYKRADI